MSAGDRRVAVFLHPGAQLVFMRGVTHRKGGRNRKRRYPPCMPGNGGAAGRLVQRAQRQARCIMPAGQAFNRVQAQQIAKSAGFDLLRVIAHQQRADRRAFAFDNGVGS